MMEMRFEGLEGFHTYVPPTMSVLSGVMPLQRVHLLSYWL